MFVANEGDSPNHFFKNLLKEMENSRLKNHRWRDCQRWENSISGSYGC
ncbi:MAG: hypothetical protein R3C26_09060 [Calditrichia bacterium]